VEAVFTKTMLHEFGYSYLSAGDFGVKSGRSMGIREILA
jgi:hypothetical protein